MQNNPFDDQQPLTPTITPPTSTADWGGWSPYPNAPISPHRTIKRWWVLGVHVALFVVALFVLSQINVSNEVRLVVTGWGGILVIHTLITCFLDVREGYIQGRRIKRMQRQAEVMEKRARMLEKLNKPE